MQAAPCGLVDGLSGEDNRTTAGHRHHQGLQRRHDGDSIMTDVSVKLFVTAACSRIHPSLNMLR